MYALQNTDTYKTERYIPRGKRLAESLLAGKRKYRASPWDHWHGCQVIVQYRPMVCQLDPFRTDGGPDRLALVSQAGPLLSRDRYCPGTNRCCCNYCHCLGCCSSAAAACPYCSGHVLLHNRRRNAQKNSGANNAKLVLRSKIMYQNKSFHFRE